MSTIATGNLPRAITPVLELVHRLDHERVALRPVVAPAGDQPDAHGIAPGHEPEAVVLDLVQPWRRSMVNVRVGSKAERLAASIFRPDYRQKRTSLMRSGTSDLCQNRK